MCGYQYQPMASMRLPWFNGVVHVYCSYSFGHALPRFAVCCGVVLPFGCGGWLWRCDGFDAAGSRGDTYAAGIWNGLWGVFPATRTAGKTDMRSRQRAAALCVRRTVTPLRWRGARHTSCELRRCVTSCISRAARHYIPPLYSTTFARVATTCGMDRSRCLACSFGVPLYRVRRLNARIPRLTTCWASYAPQTLARRHRSCWPQTGRTYTHTPSAACRATLQAAARWLHDGNATTHTYCLTWRAHACGKRLHLPFARLVSRALSALHCSGKTAHRTWGERANTMWLLRRRAAKGGRRIKRVRFLSDARHLTYHTDNNADHYGLVLL